jgi:hypothetical protein
VDTTHQGRKAETARDQHWRQLKSIDIHLREQIDISMLNMVMSKKDGYFVENSWSHSSWERRNEEMWEKWRRVAVYIGSRRTAIEVHGITETVVLIRFLGLF